MRWAFISVCAKSRLFLWFFFQHSSIHVLWWWKAVTHMWYVMYYSQPGFEKFPKYAGCVTEMAIFSLAWFSVEKMMQFEIYPNSHQAALDSNNWRVVVLSYMLYPFALRTGCVWMERKTAWKYWKKLNCLKVCNARIGNLFVQFNATSAATRESCAPHPFDKLGLIVFVAYHRIKITQVE